MEVTTILQHVFNKSSLEEIPLSAIEELTRQYPYFGAGQFLLSEKLAQEGSEGLTQQLQKTNLYFCDPLWLHHLVKKRARPSVDTNNSSSSRQPDTPGFESFESFEEETEMNEAASVNERTGGINEEAEAETETNADYSPAEVSLTTASPEEPFVTTGGPISEENSATSEDLILKASGITNTAGTTEISGIPETTGETETTGEAKTTREAEITGEAETTGEAEASGAAKTSGEVAPDNNSSEDVQEKSILSFDPYHTIDYFASLGIRVSQEIRPDDKLGNQLKSFTQWLKSMKKLPVGDLSDSTALQPYETARIQKIAAHSIEEKDVVTEAMAEVLIKQGKPGMAREVYRN